MPLQKKEENYFKDIGDSVELNRCPYCKIGMIIDTECIRRCRKCGYREEGNVPFKVKLKFNIQQEPNTKQCEVIAIEPDGKVSFKKIFQDVFTAERYVDRVKIICLPF